jgi:hypothetical protein
MPKISSEELAETRRVLLQRRNLRRNPSPVKWLTLDRKRQVAEALLARDEYVPGETFPFWTVSRTEEGFRAYRHDDGYHGERLRAHPTFILACNSVVRDAEKWLEDEPYRLMLRKHGLRP